MHNFFTPVSCVVCTKRGDVHSTIHQSWNPRRSFLEIWGTEGGGGGIPSLGILSPIYMQNYKHLHFETFIMRSQHTRHMHLLFTFCVHWVQQVPKSQMRRLLAYEAICEVPYDILTSDESPIWGQSSFLLSGSFALRDHNRHIWSIVHPFLGVHFLCAFAVGVVYSHMGGTSELSISFLCYVLFYVDVCSTKILSQMMIVSFSLLYSTTLLFYWVRLSKP